MDHIAEYVVTAKEMRRADENTIVSFGVPELVLMERAALAARDAILPKWAWQKWGWQKLPTFYRKEYHVLIAIGNGNNGGDGIALARLLLLTGQRVTVLVNENVLNNPQKQSPALRTQMEILERYREITSVGSRFSFVTDDQMRKLRKKEYDLVVDAMFGIGLSRPIEGAYKDRIEWLNSLPSRKAALDIPSGVSADDGRVLGCAFRADLTVTFGFVKRGMLLYPGKALCGKVEVADIGMTEESFLGSYPAGVTLWWRDIGAMAEMMRHKRTRDSHKGFYGKVLLFAGSKDAPGAALLAGEAVLRSGAGMLQLVSSAENRDLVLAKLPEAMYWTLEEDTDWEELIGWCDAVVAGCGIGRGRLAKQSLETIFTILTEKGFRKPIVLDADALNLTAASEALQGLIRAYAAGGGTVIMTPHMAEFARLLNCTVPKLREERIALSERYVRENGVVLVGKDAATLVCYADEAGAFRYYINQTGNNGMASAGSGDVLSGMMGAFAAFTAVRLGSFPEMQSEKAEYFETAYRAVYFHGTAGDRAAATYGETAMKAGDMIEELPGLFHPGAIICREDAYEPD